MLLCAGALGAQPLGLIQNPPARRSLSLNGSWNYLMDPYEAGYFDFHLNPIPDGGLGSNREPAGKSDKYELAFLANTPTLQVPGDWNTQKPELLWYEGTVWYRRTFDAPVSLAQPSHRQFLWFGAANYQAVVFLNGKKIGEHEGGFTPFQFEVTGQLKERGNALIVKVDDKRHSDAIPPTITDWWNYGGLTRDVKLIDEPETYVEDYFVQLEKGSRSRVAGWVRVNGSRKQQKFAIRIPEAGAGATVETDANGYARFEFPATLTLWAPENPKLYDVSIEGETDGVQDRIGFRSIEVSGQKILLNGKPVFLRGISMHAEAPFRAGRVFSEADARTLLGWAKELGCNFVRLAHYPHNESEIRLADRMGLLVWSEIPVWQDINFGNPATLANAGNQLQEMITRDHNRASVILWSISNETPVKPERLAFLKDLAAEARSLDPTRLITSAMDHFESEGPNVLTLRDPLGEFLDVLGINEYIGWYERRPQDADSLQWKSIWNKPVIVSEFGAGALYGRHGDADERWTEEYQADLYRHQLPMIQRIPNLAGLTPWLLMDFRAPGRTLPGIQDYHLRKGLISDRGERKQAFYVLQNFYRELEKTEK